MNNKTLAIFSILIGFCALALLSIQYLPALWTIETETFMTYNGVRGIAVEKNGTLWTLNFEQQNDVVAFMNQGEQIGFELIKKDPSLFSFSRLIVYQFGKPDLIFTPVTIQDGNMVFEAPLLINTGYIKEGSGGKLRNLIDNSFDQ